MVFGARCTGKTTLLKELFLPDGSDPRGTLWIDLLTDRDEELFGREPDELSRILAQ